LHPVAAAIFGATAVEHELEQQLKRRLKCNDETWAELVADNGPLRSFHTKILIGRALRIYGDNVGYNLNIVRSIRNQFAHAKKLITFQHELIVKELNKAKSIPGEGRNFHYVSKNRSGPHYAYISLCMLLISFLTRVETRALRGSVRRLRKRHSLPSALARALLQYPHRRDQELPQLWPPVDQAADPKSEAR
jgi:hypothetical protein